MGTETQKPIWMFRSDDADLTKVKNLLGLKYGSNVTTPVAIGEALRLAVAELERTDGYPRQDGPGPRSWESKYSPTTGTLTIGPETETTP